MSKILTKGNKKLSNFSIKHFDDLDDFQEFYVLCSTGEKDKNGNLCQEFRTFVKLPPCYLYERSDMDYPVMRKSVSNREEESEICSFNCFERIFLSKDKDEDGKIEWYGEYKIFPYTGSMCCMVEIEEEE